LRSTFPASGVGVKSPRDPGRSQICKRERPERSQGK
jgi:hypothetical protein